VDNILVESKLDMLEVQSQLQGRGVVHRNRSTSLEDGGGINCRGSGSESQKEGSVMHLFGKVRKERVIQKGSRAKGGRSKGNGPKAKECTGRYAKGERVREESGGGGKVEVEVRKQGNRGKTAVL
jgi:hypothetical protein